MDSSLQSSPGGNLEHKDFFRKPSTDTATRNYRKRSPGDHLPSSDGQLFFLQDLMCFYKELLYYDRIQVEYLSTPLDDYRYELIFYLPLRLKISSTLSDRSRIYGAGLIVPVI